MRQRQLLCLISTTILVMALLGCSKDSVEEGNYDTWTAGLVTAEVDDNLLYFVPANDGQGMMLTFDRTQMTFERMVQMSGGSVPEQDGGTGEAGLLTYQGNVIIPRTVNGKSVTAIDQYAFSGNAELLSVTVPDCVTEIGPESFGACPKLTTVTLPDTITAIQKGTFCGKSVQTLSVPNSVRTIGRMAFLKNTRLEEITFCADSQLETIETSAFSGCTSLISIVLPATLTTLGNLSFSGCSKLKTIHLQSATPPNVSGSAGFVSSATIYIPAGSLEAYLKAEYWNTINSENYKEE